MYWFACSLCLLSNSFCPPLPSQTRDPCPPSCQNWTSEVSKEYMLARACVCSAYHAVKRKFREFKNNSSSPRPNLCKISHKVFLEEIFSEAKEVDLDCLAPRNLDISFLITHSSDGHSNLNSIFLTDTSLAVLPRGV